MRDTTYIPAEIGNLATQAAFVLADTHVPSSWSLANPGLQKQSPLGL